MPARIVTARDGQIGFLGSIGVRFIIDGKEAGERFSLVEHPISPRALAAPLHRHTREDEYSFVVRGRVGALLGDDVFFANPGDVIVKPRNQWHTFWNAGGDWANVLEIISPAGFDRFFHELSDLGGITALDTSALDDLCSRYGLDIAHESMPDLVQRFQLTFPGERVSIGRYEIRSTGGMDSL